MRTRDETYDEMLKRIVALLFALADLAGRAQHMPRPVRALVLWVLRWGEAAARDFVGGPEQDDVLPGDSQPADALALAASFRALALALQEELAWHHRFCGRRRDRAGPGDAQRGGDRLDRRTVAARCLSWLAGFAPIPPRLDTS